MGYLINWFVTSNIDPTLICSICKDVLKDPVLLQPCQHVLCSLCHKFMRNSSDNCPEDRRKICEAVRPCLPFLKLLNNLELKCPNFESGRCTSRGKTIKLGDWPEHEETCKGFEDNTILCEEGCGAFMDTYTSKSKGHSCVAYLKSQLAMSKNDSTTHQLNLTTCERKLERCKQKLKRSRQDLILSQHEVKTVKLREAALSGGRPPPPKRLCCAGANVVVCTKRQGALDKLAYSTYIDLVESLSIGAIFTKALGTSSRGQLHRKNFIERLNAKIRMCLPEDLKLQICRWTELDTVISATPLPPPAITTVALDFEVDATVARFLVELRLTCMGAICPSAQGQVQ